MDFGRKKKSWILEAKKSWMLEEKKVMDFGGKKSLGSWRQKSLGSWRQKSLGSKSLGSWRKKKSWILEEKSLGSSINANQILRTQKSFLEQNWKKELLQKNLIAIYSTKEILPISAMVNIHLYMSFVKTVCEILLSEFLFIKIDLHTGM